MKHEPDKQRRRSIRLREYDYAQAGAYFSTIVTKDRACLFGEIVDGEMRPNQFGCIVQAAWGELPDHYQGVQCDAFMVMPNHVHGIIVLAGDGGVGEYNVGAGLKPARTESSPTTARSNTSPTIRCNGGWIGRTRFGPRIDQDKNPNRGRFDRSEIGAGFKPAPTNSAVQCCGDVAI